MIPKVIHYCWFGGGAKPKSVLKCIKNWKKYCPDYEIREWTEKDFDVNSVPYVKEAYEAKAWAFVTDYVRLWIIYNFGGIYFDTDVQVIKNFDPLLNESAFIGFEKSSQSCYVNTGQCVGAVKGNHFIKANMEAYHDMHFLNADGSHNKTSCPVITTKLLNTLGLEPDINKIQRFDEITVFPWDYFCPIDWRDGLMKKTKNTYSIHHFDAVWWGKERLQKRQSNWKRNRIHHIIHIPNRFLKSIFGEEMYEQIKGILKGKNSHKN